MRPSLAPVPRAKPCPLTTPPSRRFRGLEYYPALLRGKVWKAVTATQEKWAKKAQK